MRHAGLLRFVAALLALLLLSTVITARQTTTPLPAHTHATDDTIAFVPAAHESADAFHSFAVPSVPDAVRSAPAAQQAGETLWSANGARLSTTTDSTPPSPDDLALALTPSSSASASHLSRAFKPFGWVLSETGVWTYVYTGVYTCGAWATCGLYPYCTTTRTCDCSGGDCDPDLAPVEQQDCACTYTYDWSLSEWTTCSTSCGPGTSSRSATCLRSDGLVVSDSYCGAAELTSQACSFGNCLSFITSDWSTCSGSCGTGTQTRSVTCWDSTLGQVASSCSGYTPTSSQTCALDDCYSWHLSVYSSCSASCGPGTQTRTATCFDDTTGVVAASTAFCDTQPATSQSCLTSDCYEWRTDSSWSACSATCGTGLQTRNVWCYDTTTGTNADDDSHCSALTPPASSQSCTAATCYGWQSSEFGSCSATCGTTGVETRINECVNQVTGETVNAGNCGEPPATTRSCGVLPSCVAWQVGAFGPCDQTCGAGSQSRAVWCYDLTAGATVADSVCASRAGAGTRPDTSQTCSNGNCYVWQTGSYGTCSASCGTGTATRSVTCYDATLGYTVPDKTRCSATVTQPASTQSCLIADCYDWVPSAYGACSATCSQGTKTRTYSCMDTTLNVAADSVYCSGAPPETVTTCTDALCSDTTLSALTPSAASLTPTFKPSTRTYLLHVPVAVSSVSFFAIVNQIDASVACNSDGTLTGLVYLVPKTMTCTVTAQNGATGMYTITVDRAPATVTLLAAMNPSAGSLSPAFVSAQTSYTLFVPATTSKVTMATTVVDVSSGVACVWSPTSAATTLPEAPATSTLTCTVTAQDGVTTRAYTTVVTRGLSAVDTLKALSFSIPFTPAFKLDTYVYTAVSNVVSASTTVSVTAAATDISSTISARLNSGTFVTLTSGVAFAVAVDYGDNVLSIQVLAPNGNLLYYTMRFHRLSPVSTLATLATSATQNIKPTFDQDVYAYTLTVPSVVSSLNVPLTKTYLPSTASYRWNSGVSTATVSGITGLGVNVGDNTLVVTVVAEDLSASTNYTLVVHRLSPDASLSSIKLSSPTAALSPTFSTDTLSYTATVAYSATSIKLAVVPSNSMATIEYAPGDSTSSYVALTSGVASAAVPLTVGDYSIFVRVRSEDGLQSRVYTVTVHRKATDASLAALTVSSGSLNPTFTSATGAYTLALVATVSTFSFQPTCFAPGATLVYQWGSSGATTAGASGVAVTGLSVAPGPNLLTITVTSEDTLNKRVYTVNVQRVYDVATLTFLVLSIGSYTPSLESGAFAFSMTVSAATSSTTFMASPDNAYATLAYALNAPTIATGSYTAIIDSATSPRLSLQTGSNTLTVRCIAQDGTTTLYYVVTIYRLASGSTLASMITNATAEFTPTFSPYVTSYSLLVSSGVSGLAVTTARSFTTSSTFFSLGLNALQAYTNRVPAVPLAVGGGNTLSLVVSSEDASAQTRYTLTIYRQSSDAALTFLGINIGQLSPIFAPDTRTYSLTVGASVAAAVLQVTPRSLKATVGYVSNPSTDYTIASYTGISVTLGSGTSGSIVLNIGDNLLVVRVQAEDSAVAPVYYLLNVHRLSASSALASLGTGSGIAFSPVFAPTSLSYVMTVPSGTSKINVTASPAYVLTNVTYTWRGSVASGVFPVSTSLPGLTLPLISGDNTLVLTLVSEDGSSQTIYSLRVHRVSTMCTLDSVTLSLGSLTPTLSEGLFNFGVLINSATPTLAFTPTLTSAVSTLAVATYAALATTTSPFVALASGSSTGPLAMYEGDTHVQFRVVAEDVLYVCLYNVTVHRISADATLASIAFPTAGTVPLLTPTVVQQYRLVLASSVSQLNFTVRTHYPLATASFIYRDGVASGPLLSGSSSPVFDVPVGDTTLTVTTVAEDGVTTLTYTVSIHRISNVATLASLTTSPTTAVLVPAFSTNITSYVVTVPNAQLVFAATPTTVAPSLSYAVISNTTLSPAATFANNAATFLASGQTTQWIPLTVGDQVMIFRVIAEDAVATGYYSVRVHRLSQNAQLSGFRTTPAGYAPVPTTFKTTTLTFAQRLRHEVDSVQLVFTFTYPLSTLTYNVTNPSLVASGPFVATHSTPSAPLSLPVGITVVTAVVVSEDTLQRTTYTFSLTRVSNDSTLSSLTSAPVGYGFSPAFAPRVNHVLNLSLANSITSVRLTPTLSTLTASLKAYIGSAAGVSMTSGAQTSIISLPVGDTLVAFEVWAQDELTRTVYNVSINRISTDASIVSLRLNTTSTLNEGLTNLGSVDTLLTPRFSSAIGSYTLDLTTQNAFLVLTATSGNKYAHLYWSIVTVAVPTQTAWREMTSGVATSPTVPLPPGPSTITVRCVAQDGVNTHDVIIRVMRHGALKALAWTGLPTGVSIAVQPTFTEGVARATVTVGYLVYSTAATAVFVAGQTLMSASGSASATALTPITLVNRTQSGPIDLVAGGTATIWINNSRDEFPYSLVIARDTPIIVDITTSLDAGPALQLTPATFGHDVRIYNAVTPFISTSFRLVVTFLGTSGMTVQNLADVLDPSTVTSGVVAPVSLVQGVNPINLVSERDGTYVYNVTRLEPDVRALSLRAYLADGTTSTSLTMAPDFSPGALEYTLVVPPIMRNLSLTAVFRTIGTATVGVLNNSVFIASTTQPMTSGVESVAFPLEIGLNRLSIFSSRDGWYNLAVYRGTADVAGIILTGQHWSGSSATLVQTPAFVPNDVTVTRHLVLPKAYLTYTVTPIYSTPETLALTFNDNLNCCGGLFVPAGNVTSGVPSVPVPLRLEQNNSLAVSSVSDGVFRYVLFQARYDVISIVLASRTSDGLEDAAVLSSPMFNVSSGIQRFNVALTYRVTSLRFTPTFRTANSVLMTRFAGASLDASLALNSSRLLNGSQSDAFDLPVGSTILAVYSFLDGFFYYNVTRATPVVRALTLDLNPTGSSTQGGVTWFSPPADFASDVYTYSGATNYASLTLRLSLTVRFPTSINVTWQDALGVNTTQTVSSAVFKLDLALALGTSTLILTSAEDGIYTWSIERRVPDVLSRPQLTAYDVNGQELTSLSTAVAATEYTPAFDPLNVAPVYTLNISYIVHSLRLAVEFDTQTTVANEVTLSNGTLVQTLVSDVLSTKTFDFETEGTHLFTLTALLSGVYTLNLVRLVPDVLSLDAFAWTQNRAQRAHVAFTDAAFNSRRFTYTASVPYIIAEIDIAVRHARADAVYTLVRTSDPDTNISPTTHNVASSTGDLVDSFNFLSLPSGAWSYFEVHSLLDGVYSLAVYRASPCITGVALTANLLNDGLASASQVSVTVPTLSTTLIHTYAFSTIVDYTTVELALTITYDLTPLMNRASDLALVEGIFAGTPLDGPGFVLEAQPIPESFSTSLTPVNSTKRTQFITLDTTRTNTFRLLSAVDGNFTLTVTRSFADVKSLEVSGVPDQDGTSQSLLAQSLSPAFVRPVIAVAPMSFGVAVPFVYTRVAFRVGFASYASLTLYDLSNRTTNLLNGAWTDTQTIKLPNVTGITPTFSEYRLLSNKDGLYRVGITRAAPDLRQLVVAVARVTCDASSAFLIKPLQWSTPTSARGSFQPGTYAYSVTVPFAVSHLSVTPTCGVTWPAATLLVRLQNGLSSLSSFTSMSCNSTLGTLAELPLIEGRNVIELVSSADGSFTFTVTRQAPAILTASLTATSDTDPAIEAPFALSTTFVPDVSFKYSTVVPLRFTTLLHLSVTQSTTTPSNITFVDGTGSYYLGSGSSLTTPPTSLSEGANAVQVQSSLDGCYIFNVRRNTPAVVLSIGLGLGTSYRTLLSQRQLLAIADTDVVGQVTNAIATSSATSSMTSSQVNVTRQSLIAKYQWSANCDATSSVISDAWSFNTTGVYPCASPAAFSWSPAFLTGFVGPYTTQVASDQSAVQLIVRLANATGSGLNCVLNSASISMTADSTGTTLTGDVALVRGNNLLECSSVDGTYVGTITRGNGTWISPAFPVKLFANEQTSVLQLAGVGVSLSQPLSIQWLASSAANLTGAFGRMMPSLVPSSTIQVRAPNVTTVSTVALTFLAVGSDAWQFATPPLYSIIVYPQARFKWSNISTVGYSSLEQIPTILLTPTEPVQVGGVSIRLYVINSVASTRTYLTTIKWSAGESVGIPFTLVCPETSVPLQIQLHGEYDGGDAAHFIALDDVTLLVRPRVSFTLAPIPTHSYVGQEKTLLLAPVFAPNETVIVTLTLSPIGAIMRSSEVDSFLATWTNDTARSCTAKLCSLQLVFPAGDSTPQSFTYVAPMDIDETLVVTTIDFGLTGPAAPRFFAIPSVSFPLAHSASIAVSSVPTSILNRATSQPIRVTLSTTPPRGLTISFVCSDGAWAEPSTVSFASGAIGASFLLHAPYWYTADVSLRIQFVLGDLDYAIYTEMDDLLIPLMQQDADVRAVAFNAYGPDGNTVDISGSVEPFVGNKLLYSQAIGVAVMDPVVEVPVLRRRLLATTSTATSVSNVSIDLTAVFLTSNTVTVSIYNFDLGVATVMPIAVKSGTATATYVLPQGVNEIRLNSTLDSVYVFQFNISADYGAADSCNKQATSLGLTQYGQPSQTFVSNQASNTSTFVLCTTIPTIGGKLAELEKEYSALPKLRFTVSNDPFSSWIWLVLIVIYCMLAVTSAVLMGQQHLAREAAMGEESFLQVFGNVQESNQGNFVTRAYLSITGIATDARKHTLAMRLSLVFFSLPHLLLLLCVWRAVDMLLQYHYYNDVSLLTFRMVVGLAHVFLPWIVVGVLQQAPLLLNVKLVQLEMPLLPPVANRDAVVDADNHASPENSVSRIQSTTEDKGLLTSPEKQKVDPSTGLDLFIRRGVGASSEWARGMMKAGKSAPLLLNGLASALYIASYFGITFTSIYSRTITLERWTIGVLVGIVTVVAVLIAAESHDLTRLAKAAGLETSPKSISLRTRLLRVMRVMCVVIIAACFALMLRSNGTTLASTSYQYFGIGFYLIECVWLTLLAYLLFKAARGQRKRLMRRRLANLETMHLDTDALLDYEDLHGNAPSSPSMLPLISEDSDSGEESDESGESDDSEGVDDHSVTDAERVLAPPRVVLPPLQEKRQHEWLFNSDMWQLERLRVLLQHRITADTQPSDYRPLLESGFTAAFVMQKALNALSSSSDALRQQKFATVPDLHEWLKLHTPVSKEDIEAARLRTQMIDLDLTLQAAAVPLPPETPRHRTHEWLLAASREHQWILAQPKAHEWVMFQPICDFVNSESTNFSTAPTPFTLRQAKEMTTHFGERRRAAKAKKQPVKVQQEEAAVHSSAPPADDRLKKRLSVMMPGNVVKPWPEPAASSAAADAIDPPSTVGMRLISVSEDSDGNLLTQRHADDDNAEDDDDDDDENLEFDADETEESQHMPKMMEMPLALPTSFTIMPADDSEPPSEASTQREASEAGDTNDDPNSDLLHDVSDCLAALRTLDQAGRTFTSHEDLMETMKLQAEQPLTPKATEETGTEEPTPVKSTPPMRAMPPASVATALVLESPPDMLLPDASLGAVLDAALSSAPEDAFAQWQRINAPPSPSASARSATPTFSSPSMSASPQMSPREPESHYIYEPVQVDGATQPHDLYRVPFEDEDDVGDGAVVGTFAQTRTMRGSSSWSVDRPISHQRRLSSLQSPEDSSLQSPSLGSRASSPPPQPNSPSSRTTRSPPAERWFQTPQLTGSSDSPLSPGMLGLDLDQTGDKSHRRTLSYKRPPMASRAVSYSSSSDAVSSSPDPSSSKPKAVGFGSSTGRVQTTAEELRAMLRARQRASGGNIVDASPSSGPALAPHSPAEGSFSPLGPRTWQRSTKPRDYRSPLVRAGASMASRPAGDQTPRVVGGVGAVAAGTVSPTLSSVDSNGPQTTASRARTKSLLPFQSSLLLLCCCMIFVPLAVMPTAASSVSYPHSTRMAATFRASAVATATASSSTVSCSNLASSCSSCTASLRCGWCISNYPGVAPLCLSGDKAGPSADAGSECDLVDWNFGDDADVCVPDSDDRPDSKWPLAGVMAVMTFVMTPILAVLALVMVTRFDRRVVAAAVERSSLAAVKEVEDEISANIESDGELDGKNKSSHERASRSGVLGWLDWSSRPVTLALVMMSLCEAALKLTAIGEDEWDSEFYPGTQAEVYYGVLSGRAVYPSSSTVITSYTSMCTHMSGADKSVCLSLCASGGFLLFLGCCSVLLTIICVFVHCLSLRFPYLRGQFAASVRTLVHANTLVAVTAAITWIGTVHWLVHTMDRTSSLGPSFYIWLASIAVSVVHAATMTRAVMDTISANADEYHSLQLK